MQNKNTILVVDDQSINIDFIVTNFKDKYNIKVASNGEMALKVLDKFKIDLVLLDIQMPIMDGYETIKEIKKQDRFKDLPVIFLTAKTDSDSLIK
ncbi:MAG: response regulator, partial [Aliarcobacter cryaerophilus]